MQDRYAGDAPDFGKYFLLRHLIRESGLSLGVNWYYTDPAQVDPSGNADGEARQHLSRPEEYAALDRDLYQRLGHFQRRAQRSVGALQDAGVLPSDTVFFGETVPRVVAPSGGVCERAAWQRRALDHLVTPKMVFLDPDNGPVSASMQRRAHTKRGPKFVYCHELGDYLSRGQSVVVIRFNARPKGGVAVAAAAQSDRFRVDLNVGRGGFAVGCRSGRSMTFHVLPARGHMERLSLAIDGLCDGAGRGRFSRWR